MRGTAHSPWKTWRLCEPWQLQDVFINVYTSHGENLCLCEWCCLRLYAWYCAVLCLCSLHQLTSERGLAPAKGLTWQPEADVSVGPVSSGFLRVRPRGTTAIYELSGNRNWKAARNLDMPSDWQARDHAWVHRGNTHHHSSALYDCVSLILSIYLRSCRLSETSSLLSNVDLFSCVLHCHCIQ